MATPRAAALASCAKKLLGHHEETRLRVDVSIVAARDSFPMRAKDRLTQLCHRTGPLVEGDAGSSDELRGSGMVGVKELLGSATCCDLPLVKEV